MSRCVKIAALLATALVVLAGVGPIRVRDLSDETIQANKEVRTFGTLRIDGLRSEVQNLQWQSCRILVSRIGKAAYDETNKEPLPAKAAIDADWQRVTLTAGWAALRITTMWSTEAGFRPAIYGPWIFIYVGSIGAGAEGTTFIVEHFANGARFYSDPGNSKNKPVVLSVPCGGDIKKELKLHKGMYAEVILTDDGRCTVNGKMCGDEFPDGYIPPMDVPDDYKSFLEAANDELARVGF